MIRIRDLILESKAAEMAHKLGLEYEGYGYWSLDGEIVAKTVNGYLVKIEPKDDALINHLKGDPYGKNDGLEDDPFHDPSVKLKTHQYYTGGGGKKKSSHSEPQGSLPLGWSYGGFKKPQGSVYSDSPTGYFKSSGGGSNFPKYMGGSYGSGSYKPSGPPPQPKLKADLPMENVLTFSSESTDTPTELNGIPFESWSDAPEAPKKKYKQQSKDEDNLKWKDVEGVNKNLQEPELETDSWAKYAAGVIIMEPDGRIWLAEPTGHYAGYSHAIPKGTQEKGLSLQESAIKEAYEETGLKVEIIDYIGDASRSASTSRYYLAKRVGGNPDDKGWESYAVRLVPVEHLPQFLDKQYDDVIAKEIINRKQEFVDKVTGKQAPDLKPAAKDLSGGYSKTNKANRLTYPQLKGIKQKASNVLGTHYADASGTNKGANFTTKDGKQFFVKGGFWIGKDGVKRYVKPYKNEPEKTMGEVLTNVMLKDLGLPAPDSSYFPLGENQFGFASAIVPNVKGELYDLAKQNGGQIPKEVAERILDGFAADCLMANWDVVGVNEGFMRNIVMVDDGSEYGMPVRIDNGGSWLSRGLNGRKDTIPSYGEQGLYKVSELQQFFNNPGYKRVLDAAGIKKAEDLGYERWHKQVSKIVALHNKYKNWEKYVEEIIPDIDKKDKDRIIKMLYTRTQQLIEFVQSLPKPPEPPKKETTKEPTEKKEEKPKKK
jgi:ADP-ribose pyrophosphatase YjhB (NUDIX family)